MKEIYVDGSAHPNPGPGGFGAVVYENGVIIDAYTRQFPQTTNNECELKGILWAALIHGNKENPPIVYTDSAYAYNCLVTWSDGWCKAGWVRPKGKKIENLEIIKAFYERCRGTIELRKCAGHSGVEGNMVADKLATGKVTPEEVLK